MKNITRQTKSAFGMNRNDFFEYKKNRVIELAKKGATIDIMAKDLGLDEKGMYSFLSRNFGGVRNLRNFVNQAIVSDFNGSVLSKDEPKVEAQKKSKSTNENKNVLTPTAQVKDINSVVDYERDKILNEFKNIIEKDTMLIAEEVKKDLDAVRSEILKNFKAEIVRGLSGLASSL